MYKRQIVYHTSFTVFKNYNFNFWPVALKLKTIFKVNTIFGLVYSLLRVWWHTSAVIGCSYGEIDLGTEVMLMSRHLCRGMHCSDEARGEPIYL